MARRTVSPVATSLSAWSLSITSASQGSATAVQHRNVKRPSVYLRLRKYSWTICTGLRSSWKWLIMSELQSSQLSCWFWCIAYRPSSAVYSDASSFMSYFVLYCRPPIISVVIRSCCLFVYKINAFLCMEVDSGNIISVHQLSIIYEVLAVLPGLCLDWWHHLANNFVTKFSCIALWMKDL